MVLEHLGLVKYILYRDFQWLVRQGLGKDMYQQGVLGLIKATYRYDPTKGMKFSSYAVWWIKMYIRQGIRLYGKDVRVVRNPDREIPFNDEIWSDLLGEKNRLQLKKKIIIWLGLLAREVEQEDIDMLKMRFGISSDKRKKSYAAIAKEFGTTTNVVKRKIVGLLKMLKDLKIDKDWR